MSSAPAAQVARLVDRLRAITFPLRARWQSLTSRDQAVVLGMSLVLSALLIWALVWRPLQQERAQLQIALPAMAAQLATMRIQAEEINRLNAVPAAAGSASAGRRLADVAGLQQIMGDEVRVQMDGNVRFLLSAKKISFAQFIDRIDTVLASFDLRIVTLNVTALPNQGTAGSIGQVSIEAVLVDSNRQETSSAAAK